MICKIVFYNNNYRMCNPEHNLNNLNRKRICFSLCFFKKGPTWSTGGHSTGTSGHILIKVGHILFLLVGSLCTVLKPDIKTVKGMFVKKRHAVVVLVQVQIVTVALQSLQVYQIGASTAPLYLVFVCA